MMLERVIFEIVKTGFDWFIADSKRFARWLVAEQLIDESEAENARLYFEGQPLADPPVDPKYPHLIHGFARTGGPFPCIALTLGSEDISTDYLGRDALMIDSDGEYYIDEESREVVDPRIRRLRYTFNFMIHAPHPDVCVWYYHLLKFIIMKSHDEFEAHDVEDLTFSGRDLAPDPRYLPDDIFTRLLSITVEGDETWESEIPGGFASQTGGIFHEQSNSSSGNSGKIKLYAEENP